MQRYQRLIKLFGIKATIQSFNSFLGVDCLRCASADFDAVVSELRYADILRFRAYCDSNEETDSYDLINAA